MKKYFESVLLMSSVLLVAPPVRAETIFEALAEKPTTATRICRHNVLTRVRLTRIRQLPNRAIGLD